MKRRVLKFVQYGLLVCLLFISSFGVVMARYQISHNEEVAFKVRGVGSYYVENASSQWSMNYATGYLESNFSIYNYSGTTMSEGPLSFHVRIRIPEYLSDDISFKLIAKDISGTEQEFSSKYIGSTDEYREYVFIEESTEVEFSLSDKMKSYVDFVICAISVSDAFLSEVVIVDAGYNIETEMVESFSQFYPLEVNSNFLSKDEVHNVYVDGETTISMISNMGMYSEVSCNYDGDLLFPYVSEESLYLPSGKEQSVTLSWSMNEEAVALISEETRETITVIWNVIDDGGTVLEQWSANFIVSVGPMDTFGESTPTITMDYIDNNEVFSQLRPLQCKITSSKDYLVYLIEEDFLAGTKYSLDNGASWLVLNKDGGIPVYLQADIHKEIIIKPNLSNWETNYYKLYVDCNGKWETYLQFLKKNEEIKTPLVITGISSGNIKDQTIMFSVNKIGTDSMSVESLNMTVEYLNDGNYETIQNDLYFNWTTESVIENINYTLSGKENVDIPSGTYRIRIEHLYSNNVVDVQYVSFFVKA